MTAQVHDPGVQAAAARAVAGAGSAPVWHGGAEIRIGTAGWTDRTLTAAGAFYPSGVTTPEDRLRYYASCFSLVEADAGFYAIPNREMAERWVERTPAG